MTSEHLFDLTPLALRLLKHFGNSVPTSQEVIDMKNLLSNITIQASVVLDKRLTPQETHCLLLAAHGKTSNQTAKLLNIGIETVRDYRKEIRRKLGCSTMAHAVYQGIRYGYFFNAEIPPV